MRILHVVWTLDPAAGGPPHVAVRLAAAQAALGHDVVVSSYADPAENDRVSRQMADVPHLDRISFRPLVDPGPLGRLLATGVKGPIRDLAGAADFVHIHGVWHPILIAAAEATWSVGIPYCFRPAGMLHPWSLARKRLKKHLALTFGYRDALRRASFIHALNEDERQAVEAMQLGIPTRVLPNGVFLEEILPLPEPGTFRTAHPEVGEAPFILFLSRLHMQKGLDVLAEAFIRLAPRHPDVRLVVAGPDGGARQAFLDRVMDAGVADRVHAVGPLYGVDKLAAMTDSACFCLPSRHEGFSVTITEALACGVPVVVSTSCHFPEVAEAGAGAVVPLEPGDVSSALGRILTDPILSGRMRVAGAELVRARYTWEAIAARSIEAYREAIGARS